MRNFAHCLNTHLWYSIIFGLPFFLIAFIVAVVKLIFFADFTVFPAIMQSTFDTSKQGFEISLGLTGVLSLWLGIMKVGEKGGVVNALARLLGPIFARLFPDVPKGHPVVGNIFYESGSQYAWIGQCGDAAWAQSDGGFAGIKRKKGHGLESYDYVPRLKHFRAHVNPCKYYDVQISVRRRPTYGYFCAYSARDIRIYACGHHHYVALSAHQSLQSYAFADAWRNVGLLWLRLSGFLAGWMRRQ